MVNYTLKHTDTLTKHTKIIIIVKENKINIF